MNQLCTALALTLLSTTAFAQTHQITWELTNFATGGTTFTWLELDVEETGRYFSANGAVLTQSRALSPVSGTCARINSGYFCNLQLDRGSYFLNVDAELNGKLTGRDSTGAVVPEAAVTLHEYR